MCPGVATPELWMDTGEINVRNASVVVLERRGHGRPLPLRCVRKTPDAGDGPPGDEGKGGTELYKFIQPLHRNSKHHRATPHNIFPPTASLYPQCALLIIPRPTSSLVSVL